MKKIILFGFLSLLIFSVSFVSYHRTELAPPPVVCEVLSPAVPMNFKISKVDMSQVEVQLDDPSANEDFYMQMNMGNSWKGGRTGLRIAGCSKNSRMRKAKTRSDFKRDMIAKNRGKNKGKAKNDFTTFMESDRGEDLDVYQFEYTLVKGEKGGMFLKKTYIGPDMPLLDVLEIEDFVPVPKFISKRFTKGKLRFTPGNVGLNREDNSYYIPVERSSR